MRRKCYTCAFVITRHARSALDHLAATSQPPQLSNLDTAHEVCMRACVFARVRVCVCVCVTSPRQHTLRAWQSFLTHLSSTARTLDRHDDDIGMLTPPNSASAPSCANMWVAINGVATHIKMLTTVVTQSTGTVVSV
jgi:hypothetical protein